eukprot:gene7061-14365_t
MIVFEYLLTMGLIKKIFGFHNLLVTSDHTHQSMWGTKGRIPLLVFRLCGFGFFLGVDVIYHDVVLQSAWWYYTFWNIYLTTLYFGCTSISSIASFIYGESYAESNFGKALGKCIVIMYPTWGALAFFITVVNFTLLTPEFTFWNVCEHFVTTMSVLVEMSMNAHDIHPDQFLFCGSWLLLYVIFAWCIVGGGLRFWPYFFLDTSTTSSFLWYSLFYMLSILFFILFWSMHKLKIKIFKYIMKLPTSDASRAIAAESPYGANGAKLTEMANKNELQIDSAIGMI